MNYPLAITKDEINQLPLYSYNGTIVVVESQQDALVAVEALKFESVLGFDTETRPAFVSGKSYSVALLQLATESTAYLFRLNKFKMIPELTSIFEDSEIVKAGVGLLDDIKALKKLLDFKDQNFFDLATMAKNRKIENFGLRALTAILLKKRLSKKEKVSNWERQTLTQGQIAYAASDAAVGYQIYHALID